MKKAAAWVLVLSLLSVSSSVAQPPTGNWPMEDGIAAVLDPENDGSEIGDEAAGRDDSALSEPWAEYYWRFDGLIRIENIPGPFVDHGDGTASRSIEVLRTGGTFKIHGDHLWGQPPETVYDISIDSHFTGFNHFEWIDDQWVWKGTVGSSHVRGAFSDDPFLFELTDHVIFDFYGYNAVVGHNVYSGTMTNVLISIFLMGDGNADGDVDGSDLAAYIIDPEGIDLAAMAENFGKHDS